MEVIMVNPSKRIERLLILTMTAILMVVLWASAAAAQVSFKEDVFPIIEIRCLECHQSGGEGYETSGLDMSSYEGLMKGTKNGPMITPGNAVDSNLLAVIDRRTSSEIWMPHEGKQLSKCERQAFRFWVLQGAQDN
jgi:hypothetical protein